ncbi:MAG TPA: threonylcarbamoyl-AMP synthase [Gammaproteobacteria bacterium]|nr:threonylcarbamoyl-AMP synthase [Gammaproteobacteria bacterium]
MATAFPPYWRLALAARQLRAGGIVAYPTESVFGLGCDPANAAAVMRLLELKRRPPSRGLILIAADWTQLEPWVGAIPASSRRRLEAGWPGAITWLLPASADCPRWLTGEHDTVAVRIPGHALARRLCRRAGTAIVSTSANRSGQRPARSVLEVQLRLGRDIDGLLPGETGGRPRPSEIRHLATGATVRTG